MAIWTPTRDAFGDVTPESIAELPLNEFVEVAGSDLIALQDKMTVAFNAKHGTAYDWTQINLGPGSLYRAMNGWSSMTFSPVDNTLYTTWDGGHTNGKTPGVQGWSFTKMDWVVKRPVPNPDDPVFPWCATYRTTGWSDKYECPTVYTDWTPTNILPDGTPTPQHHYDGLCIDAGRNAFHAIDATSWSYRMNDDAFDKARWWKPGGAVVGVGYPGAVTWNEYAFGGEGAVFGFIKPGAYEKFDAWFNANPRTGELVRTPGLRKTDTEAAISVGYNVKVRRKEGTPHVLMMSDNTYRVWDLQAEVFLPPNETTYGQVTPPLGAYSGMPGIAWVPDWGKWLRWVFDADDAPGLFYLFDDATGIQTAVDFVGAPIMQRNMGNKFDFCPSLNAVFAMSPDNSTGNALFIMRIGDPPVVVDPPANQPPITSTVDFAPVVEGSAPVLITEADLLSASIDPDGDVLMAHALNVAVGTGTLTGTGPWEYTLGIDEVPVVEFSYTITDGEHSVPGTATLPVLPAPATLEERVDLLEAGYADLLTRVETLEGL